MGALISVSGVEMFTDPVRREPVNSEKNKSNFGGRDGRCFRLVASCTKLTLQTVFVFQM